MNCDSPEMLFTLTSPPFLPAAWFPVPVVCLSDRCGRIMFEKQNVAVIFRSRTGFEWCSLEEISPIFSQSVFFSSLCWFALNDVLISHHPPGGFPCQAYDPCQLSRPCQSNLSNLLKGQRPGCSSCIPIKLNTTELEALRSKQASV